MRVHELAKEFDAPSKDLLTIAHDLGIEAKSHMSALTDDDVAKIRARFGSATVSTQVADAEPVPEPPAVEAAPAEPAKEAPVATAQVAPPPRAAPAAAPGQLTDLIIRGAIVVRDYADQLGLKPNQLIAELMGMNVFASINDKLELKVAQQIAEKHGFKLQHEKKIAEKPAPKSEETDKEPEEDRPEELVNRPPVVAFLGHVDHGKTSLLDKIRDARVAAGEDGGITQHIGAYTVEHQDQPITFLDTPGHEAFTAMRARGANLTDIVVLIVAADDGIMPQTKEAIQHAQAADVCLMVAINKIDLQSANVERVKQQLQQAGLTPEDWGGETIVCPVSAETGEGIDHLLEMIILQSEVLELKANPTRRAQGYVVEAQLEPGMGPTAHCLVRRGTLKVGDPIVCGPYWGRVKALISDTGKKVRTAGPSSAVKCLGLTNVPEAGAEFVAYSNDRIARQLSEERTAEIRQTELEAPKRATLSLDDLLSQAANADEHLELNLILKADVQGSLEAIIDSLKDIKSDKISIRFVLTGVGNIKDNDVLLASASGAIVIGFHVSTEPGVNKTAKREGIEVRLYSVIYELLDDVRSAMTGRLKPLSKENVIGHVEIRQIFDLTKRGRVAGCMVVDGRVKSRSRARVMRATDVVYEGSVDSLKRFQNDASEVREGQECGIRLDNFSSYEEGDVIEVYEMEEVAQQL